MYLKKKKNLSSDSDLGILENNLDSSNENEDSLQKEVAGDPALIKNNTKKLVQRKI